MDEKSRYLVVACMQSRGMLRSAYDQAVARFSDLGVSVSKLHSDGAKECLAMQNDLGGGDKVHKSFSPPYTPELNVIAKRVNLTMEEAARTIPIQANLPRSLWPFALKHANFVRNRVAHSSTGITPYFSVTGDKPNFKYLHVFGCGAYVLRLPRGSNFKPRAYEGVYLETFQYGVYRVLITEENDLPKVVESPLLSQ